MKDRSAIAMHDIGIHSDCGAEAGDQESDAERRRQAGITMHNRQNFPLPGSCEKLPHDHSIDH